MPRASRFRRSRPQPETLSATSISSSAGVGSSGERGPGGPKPHRSTREPSVGSTAPLVSSPRSMAASIRSQNPCDTAHMPAGAVLNRLISLDGSHGLNRATTPASSASMAAWKPALSAPGGAMTRAVQVVPMLTPDRLQTMSLGGRSGRPTPTGIRTRLPARSGVTSPPMPTTGGAAFEARVRAEPRPHRRRRCWRPGCRPAPPCAPPRSSSTCRLPAR